MFNVVIAKAGSAKYEIDFESLPEVSRKRVIHYGLTQILADAAAAVATTSNVDGRRVPLKGKDLAAAHMAAKKEVDERLADLSAGILRRARETDAVGGEARRIAIRIVQKDATYIKWLSDKGLKPTDKGVAEELSARAAIVAAWPKVIVAAERRVAEMAELAELA